MEIQPLYLNKLSKVFSPIIFDAFLKKDNKKIKLFANNIIETGILDKDEKYSLAKIFDILYTSLNANYRCEYLYKNSIAQQLLIQRHNLKESLLLSEFRANNSLADVVILNGTSTVYEIKTELDSLDRLSSQLSNYNKIFDKINVVTYIDNIESISKVIDDHVGIIILSNDMTLETIREASSNKANIDLQSVFNSLRKSEYISIINEEFGFVPDVPNTKIHKACENLFIEIPKDKAHDYMVKALLNRKLKNHQIDFVNKVPDSLKMLSLSKNYREQDCQVILKKLDSYIN